MILPPQFYDLINDTIHFIPNALNAIGNVLNVIIEIPALIGTIIAYPFYITFYHATTIIEICINVISGFMNSFNVIFDRVLSFFFELISIFPPPIMFLLGVILLSIILLRIIKLLPTFD